MILFKEYLGEFIGTFVLVFIGCGSVGLAVFYGVFTSLLQVALVWGAGVALAIYLTRKICPAHLNPAVSIAMCLAKKLPVKKLPIYIIAQFFGALVAGCGLYFFLQNGILSFEELNSIVRGTAGSRDTAMMFGEFFPNPGYVDTVKVTHLQAVLWETAGTFALVFVIFRLTYKKRKFENLIPLFIGLTVSLIICVVAPYTQAGLNPARDFGPRIVAYFSGWEKAAFPAVEWSFLTVYILGPIIGGAVAHYLQKLLVSVKKA